MRRVPILTIALFVLVAMIAACATSPTGRPQLALFPSGELAQMGATAFETLQEQVPVSDDVAINRYVACVSDHIVAQVDDRDAPDNWDVVVFEEPSANAFALPGGKIGVHTGLLDVATDQDQLATVIGHEVGHILADHANERMSTAYAAEAGLGLIEVLAGGPSASQSRVMAVLGLGAQFGILMPFNRAQESEADIIGLELMAQAGFDPRQSLRLWENMAAAADGEPPEFLSTHPSHGRRIDDLQRHMPRAMEYYEQARAEGRRPRCS